MTWGCYGTCAVSHDLAAHECAQAAQDESDTVYEHIRTEVDSSALQAICASPTIWTEQFTAWCAVETLPESARDQIAEAVRLLQLNRDAEALALIRAAFSTPVAEAADRFATNETARLHDEWKRTHRAAA
jgi:hypothetical protein